MRGFVGGQWGYVLDSNETKGVEIKPRIDASPSPSPSLTETETETEDPQSGSLGPGLLKDEERRLALYCLGWESTEVRKPDPSPYLNQMKNENNDINDMMINLASPSRDQDAAFRRGD